MTDRTPPFKFTTNVPVNTRIAFVDVRPGKPWTDPQTGQTKVLPAQVSLKGTFDGVSTICFLPGAAWKNLKALHEAGVIGDYDKNAEDPGEVLNLPVLDGNMRATLAKPAGAKYADMVYVPLDKPQAPQPRRIPPPEHVGNRPPVHIPEIDGPLDDDTPYADGDDGDIIGPDPPMTAREVNAKIAAVSKRGSAVAFYVGLYGQMLQGMSDLHTKTNIPLTADAVQAATATVYIRMGNSGLLP